MAERAQLKVHYILPRSCYLLSQTQDSANRFILKVALCFSNISPPY